MLLRVKAKCKMGYASPDIVLIEPHNFALRVRLRVRKEAAHVFVVSGLSLFGQHLPVPAFCAGSRRHLHKHIEAGSGSRVLAIFPPPRSRPALLARQPLINVP